MKNAILKTAILALGVSLTMASCSKSDTTVPANPNPPVNPNPNPNPTVTNTVKLSDIQDRYFVIQKTVGKPLAVLYFVNDGGLKFYYDTNGGRRVGTPVITNLDSTSGNATLAIDLNGDGTNALEFSLSKPSGGTLVLLQTKYESTTASVTSSGMYSTADAGSFIYNGLLVEKTFVEAGVSYKDIYNFSATNCSYKKYKLNNINGLVESWDKSYYALPGNVGFKVADPGVMGVFFKNSSGKPCILVEKGGVIREFEVI